MKVLILGASGATGKQVMMQLIEREIHTRIVIRNGANIPGEIRTSNFVEIINGNISEFNEQENRDIIDGCNKVVCCLGHNISLKGIFGKPHLLVYRSLRNICDTIERFSEIEMKVVLMSTVAYDNRKTGEKRSFFEKIILSMLYMLLPPHKDNVCAANYLLKEIGKNNEKIEWVAVRPDSLIDKNEVSPYEVVESIERSPLFDPGKTSRINVGHFIVELLTNDELWKKWKGETPVIYNRE